MMNVDTADLESLGSFIRGRRQALGLTQTQLGERLGWMQERVSILENGKYGMPSLPALARLAIACEVPLMQILRAAGYGDESQVEEVSRTAEHPNGPALLYTLQQLMAIDVGTMSDALNEAADLVAGVMGADKVDALIYEPATKSLVALGASNTEMGRHQREVGMDRLPIANRGREVEVFETGEPYLTGDAKHDPLMLVGMVEGLGISSCLAVPLSVGGTRRGVLVANSSHSDQFHEEDVPFFETVARWVGMTAHRAELMEEVQRDAVEKARRTGAEELVEFMGHDTKLYLEPVMQHLDALCLTFQQNGQAKHARDLEFVRESVGQVQRSIDDLLDASALERGLVPLKVESIDLVGLVREVVEQYREGVAPVHVRAPEGLQAQLDAARIRSAIDALVRNALRRSPGGLPVVVDVEIQKFDGNDQVVVSVQDEGTSIDADALYDLATGFSGHTNSPSHGLSLYQARSAAEAHGGVVTVDTPSLNSAVFRLSLPLTSSENSRAN
jgi:signal transduction histidine kinase/transcriptional regulator with XRE-family HTH domain